jgi:predicted ATP-grasp superfamily ATP-dependent carboligase
MNSSKRKEREMKDLIKFTLQPELEKPSLIIGWREDPGRLGPNVINYLNKTMMNRSFCQISPVDFFSLGGVEIKGNVARLPESRFYAGVRNDIITFLSDFPHFNQYTFLNTILDIAQDYCKVEEVYTVSGLVSPIAHTIPRRTFAVYNEPALQEKLRGYGLHDISYEGPPHLNSYLLWAAQKRGLRGVSLWPQIPFYLAASEDPQAVRLTLSFLNRRFNLNADLKEWNENIKEQYVKISRLRARNPEVQTFIERLETGLSLTEAEEMKLAEEVPKFLRKKG